jgi:hypothetical protein
MKSIGGRFRLPMRSPLALEGSNMPDDNVILNETQASGGVKPHILRYMLIASLALVITVFAILFYWVPFSVN